MCFYYNLVFWKIECILLEIGQLEYRYWKIKNADKNCQHFKSMSGCFFPTSYLVLTRVS